MKEALLRFGRPANLSEEEKKEYDFLLERSFPLEERAVAYYRNGVAAARRANVHAVWVDRMSPASRRSCLGLPAERGAGHRLGLPGAAAHGSRGRRGASGERAAGRTRSGLVPVPFGCAHRTAFAEGRAGFPVWAPGR